MAKHWHKGILRIQKDIEAEPVRIISDAAVATQDMAGGRMIPLIILDTAQRPDIEEAVRLHRDFGPGDAATTWSKPSRWNDDRIRLIIQITKPTQCTMILEFDLMHSTAIVDQIIMAQGLYLQPGRDGDRLITTYDHERVLIEVPCTREFRSEWDRIIRKATIKSMRNSGLSRTVAKQAADHFITEWRRAMSIRAPSD